MRLAIPCMRCFRERGQPDDALYPAELQDDGRYKFRCRFGHDAVTILQQHKFEVLSELALNALLDGYYRDAVASFASSLELFREFFIRVIATKYEIDDKVFSGAWKNLSSQSERQLGAFVMTYTLEMKAPPLVLQPKMVEFRNAVIHKGAIPSKEQAVTFGEAVLDVIQRILVSLKTSHGKYIQHVVGRYVAELNKAAEHYQDCATMSIPTLVSLVRHDSGGPPSLLESIEALRKRRAAAGW